MVGGLAVCECCGKEHEPTGRERKHQYCSGACRVKLYRRDHPEKAEEQRKARAARPKKKRGRKKHPRGNCLYCGASLDRKPPTNKYCSDECARAARAIPLQACKQCGKKFKPKRGDRTTFCSRACAHAWQKAHARPKPEKVEQHCAVCRRALPAGARKLCSEECRREYKRRYAAAFDRRKKRSVTRRCPECRQQFVPEYGDKHRKFCSDECGRRAGRRVAKATRKARIRGATRCEAIDPKVVFCRDNWRCYICGRHTPKRLRGTTDERAPELEHIILIKAGGTHTYDNVACACRRCNGEKSDRPLAGRPRGIGPFNLHSPH